MRPIRPIALFAAGALLAAPALLPCPAFAQGNPSADSIINSLRPNGNMTGSTRGIRPLAPGAGGSGAPAVVAPAGVRPVTPGARPGTPPPAAATATAGAPSVSMTVQFATNSADLTPAAMRTLDELGRALSSPALSGYRFRIEGHTDTVGSRDKNIELSQARAAKVVDYLSSKYNVDRAKVEAVGVGPDELAVRTGANVAEPRNRRVTVVNVGT